MDGSRKIGYCRRLLVCAAQNAPSSLHPILPHSWVCSSLSCKSQGSLAEAVAKREHSPASAALPVPCATSQERRHSALLTHPGPLCCWGCVFTLPSFQLFPSVGGFILVCSHHLYPSLVALVPGPSQSLAWDWDHEVQSLGLPKSRLWHTLPSCFLSLQHTCSLLVNP